MLAAPSVARGHLGQLHAAAIRIAQSRPQLLVDTEAAHGLEQQLIHAVVNCVPAELAEKVPPTTDRYQDILSRFEDLLHAQPNRSLSMAEICAALSVSDRLLRRLCSVHLGVGPIDYIRLRRMSLVRRDLWRGSDGAAGVSQIAQRHGFANGSRFAASYRKVFGELPSVTLRRSLRAGTADLTRRR